VTQFCRIHRPASCFTPKTFRVIVASFQSSIILLVSCLQSVTKTSLTSCLSIRRYDQRSADLYNCS